MRGRLHLLAVPALVALSGCLTEERFYHELTEAVCERAETCYADTYELIWGDGACLEDADALRDEWHEGFEDCEYDRGAARECLDLWRDITCNFYPTDMEGYEVCTEVYTCP